MTPEPYPRIPHLVAGRGTDDDLTMSARTVRGFLSVDVEVEEKLDGANTMCWLDDGILRASGRSGPDASDRAGQFGRLRAWVAEHEDEIRSVLGPGQVLYGEWLYLQHTIRYERLPSLFVAIDLREADGSFVPTSLRRATLEASGLRTPPVVGRGRFTLAQLEEATRHSAYADGPAEGVIVRPLEPHDGADRVAKLVRAGFRPVADTEWRRGRPKNGVAS